MYPGANHTRFEHSLGVSHQVSQILRALNDHDESQGLDSEWTTLLRVAALLHDVGHGLMSHVVEIALNGNDDVDDLLLQFKKNVQRASTPQLSEMAAYFIVRSPAARELLSTAFSVSSIAEPDELVHRVSRMIIGKSVDNQLPIVHELISGPFDADKLDYIPRDALMCGVPAVTDVVRLIQKVRAVSVNSNDLPEEMTPYIREEARGHVVIGVARSGASALDEVSLSRALMFNKIYRHQKVRAVESMVSAVLQISYPAFDPSAAMLPLKVTDDAFVELEIDDLNRLNLAAGSPVSVGDLKTAGDILGRIRDRRLFGRAFAFAQTMPFDAYRDDSEQEQGNERFIREISENVERRSEFIRAIVEEVTVVAEALGRESDLAGIGLESLHHYIRVDPPATGGRGSESDQSRAYLIDEAGNLLKVEKMRAEARGWADAYVNAKDVGYIFVPPEIADLVHIASEVVIRQKYGVRIPKQMHHYAKKGGSDLDRVRRDLASLGYFKDKPADLAPPPAVLETLDSARRISAAVETLRGYMGPSSRASAGSNAVNAIRVRHWVSQFPEQFIPLAIKTVGGVRMLTRADANSTLRSFVSKHSEFEKASLVPLGEPKDGSAVHAYFAGDAAQELGWTLRSLNEALVHEEPIVFIDDIVGLGRSASNIFGVLLGGETDDDLGEDREVALDPAQVERLRQRSVAVVWAAGYEDGAAKVRTALQDLGVAATVHIEIPSSDLPTVVTVLHGEDGQLVAEYTSYLKDVSRGLLEHAVEDKREQRLLGYGNLGLLVVNAYNTPTATLTPLWASGAHDGKPWVPLFPRRKKN